MYPKTVKKEKSNCNHICYYKIQGKKKPNYQERVLTCYAAFYLTKPLMRFLFVGTTLYSPTYFRPALASRTLEAR